MDFSAFLNRPVVADHRAHFEAVLAERCRAGRHGDLPNWLAILDALPELRADLKDYASDTVRIGSASPVSDSEFTSALTSLDQGLRALSPWRKGPYQIFNSFIDTEWRSDWKWQRIAPHLSSLSGRRVLDVGCGTGYHGWRMLGQGASQVLGIDPSMRFLVQFLAVQKYAQDTRFDFLPIGIEDMPRAWPVFDTVFSMGVIYHRRNPLQHLTELANLLTAKGELVLETLIVDQAEEGVLRPEGRYAKMRNVWSIMTVDKILALLTEAGFKHGRCVDENITSLDEQRQTDWMQFHSLAQFLDPNDPSKTVEGYPAPKRGTFIAQMP